MMVTLLIADDEQLERQALRHIIEKNCDGITILGETGDGTSAVRIAAAEKPDIILMDIRMPELNGLDAAKAIRNTLPATEIVILTAFDEFNYAKQALSLGATEYLMKPVRPNDLLNALTAVVAKITESKRKMMEETELRKSLDDAKPFIQMSFVYDLLSGEHSNLADINSFHYPFSCERTVADNIRCGERKQAQEALLRLLNEMFASRASIGTVKASVLELLIVLSRAAVEGGANLEQLTLLNVNRINQLMTCSDCQQVGRWMLDTLDQLMDNMLAAQSKAKVRLINKACEYIGKHCNRELPLEHVAQMVHLSPYYFSRLFKREKNCTFVAFLTQVRIERAKRLLQNSDLTVARVAKESGYRDAGYFCRVFRQVVGVTPNQYRSERRIEQKRDTTESGAGLPAGQVKSE